MTVLPVLADRHHLSEDRVIGKLLFSSWRPTAGIAALSLSEATCDRSLGVTGLIVPSPVAYAHSSESRDHCRVWGSRVHRFISETSFAVSRCPPRRLLKAI